MTGPSYQRLVLTCILYCVYLLSDLTDHCSSLTTSTSELFISMFIRINNEERRRVTTSAFYSLYIIFNPDCHRQIIEEQEHLQTTNLASWPRGADGHRRRGFL